MVIGADPKSVVCAFFKLGQCTKGAKCKFSHDLAVERKGEKRSIYVDMRDDDEENALENGGKEIIEKSEGDKNRPTTDIVSDLVPLQVIYLYTLFVPKLFFELHVSYVFLVCESIIILKLSCFSNS